jgi:hypothetical protein
VREVQHPDGAGHQGEAERDQAQDGTPGQPGQHHLQQDARVHGGNLRQPKGSGAELGPRDAVGSTGLPPPGRAWVTATSQSVWQSPRTSIL